MRLLYFQEAERKYHCTLTKYTYRSRLAVWLTAADYSTGDYYHYTYDEVGNRLSQDSEINNQQTTTNYIYDNANRLTNVNSVNYTWDANGNLRNDGVSTYTYDPANRLAGVAQGSNTYTYAYNGLGDRLQQIANGQTTNYTLDLNAGLTQVLDDGTNTYTYGVDRISQQHGSTAEYYLDDALGSVRQLADENDAITLSESYDPYGNVISRVRSSGTSVFGYTGEQADQSGLTYLRARYYSSDNGRFLTRDIWDGDPTFPMSFDQWEYVYGNPINYLDSTGHITEQEASRADFIVNMLQNNYGVKIQKDWGNPLVQTDLSSLAPYISTGLFLGLDCEWKPGRWDIVELRTIRDAVKDLGKAMNGQFKKFIGPVTMKISDHSLCGGSEGSWRGCTYNSPSQDIYFHDKGKPPTNVYIADSYVNIDKWSVVHELGHAWDRNYDGDLSRDLVWFTNGYFDESRPSNCDTEGNINRLPGCNSARYHYKGIPPAGSDINFNPQEDFAESVAAFVYPQAVQEKVDTMVKAAFGNPLRYTQYYNYLYYKDYTKTARWAYINGLINLGTNP